MNHPESEDGHRGAEENIEIVFFSQAFPVEALCHDQEQEKRCCPERDQPVGGKVRGHQVHALSILRASAFKICCSLCV